MKKKPSSDCPDCGDVVSRRKFLKSATTAAAASAILPYGAVTFSADAKEAGAGSVRPKAESLVKTLYDSLSEEQRGNVCMGFDHQLRSRVENNWHILKQHRINAAFNKEQQAMIREIFLNIHSEEYRDAVMRQVEHDNGKGGFGSCSVALFGKPGSGKFEFVFTGRHVTRRCDGDSLEGTAFGGPIFYGHAARSFYEKPEHKDNVYWFQAKRANEVFQMMNGKQRKMALLDDSRGEHGTSTVKLTGKTSGLAGIPMTELTADQKAHVRKVMHDLLAPFRKEDRVESMKLIEKSGFDHLHLSFYRNEDVGKDGVWDVFQIEGPHMVWYFRGDPHVHTWVHIKDRV
jgi:hypothetical protein